MILIPVIGRTRSSVVTGIFHICGAWVGPSSVSMINRYDTFENWDVVTHLMRTYAKQSLMDDKNARKEAVKFRQFIERTVPQDRLVCLKFVWYYEPLFRAAFPECEYFFIRRTDNLGKRKHGGRRFVEYVHTMSPKDGTWIDTTDMPSLLVQMKTLVDAHPNLEWREKEIREFLRTGVDIKFEKIRRVDR